MKTVAPKRQRCAIYTRKSTEHNLDLAFNSLDAQREACEAYIRSQAHEGWALVRDKFDDGGLSGASLDRPALRDLLNKVRARQIDIIVVYKVDRLTRSLADFAKLVEVFDEHDVSFVSVTQSFNTTSSMGRLTLNVLLSFAQFEREVIGERVRDKIAASKRKGIWVGGPVPLGYRSVDKKLEIVPEESDLVRKIFHDYLRLGSISALAGSLNAEGTRPKPRRLANGRTVAAACYRVGPLAHLLKNRFYIGEVAYRGEIHPGEHQPILDRALFDAVQTRLKEQAVGRSAIRSSSPALLAGRIFDDRNNPMTPTHANKKGVRYRYYVSHALVQGRASEAGSVARISAPDVEALITNRLRANSDAGDDASDREIIENHFVRAIVGRDQITITPRLDASVNDANDQSNGPTISVPFTATLPLRKGISHSPLGRQAIDEATRSALLTAIAR
jgi:site-specific DNA recombinase